MSVFATECEEQAQNIPAQTIYSASWGLNPKNHRYQPASLTSIDSGNVHRLNLKWVHRLSTSQPRSYPVIFDDRLIIGDGPGGLIALNLDSGCEIWRVALGDDAGTGVAYSKVDDRDYVFTATRQGAVFAVDALTGEELWQRRIDFEPTAMHSGSVLAVDGKLFVPMSSYEIGLAVSPLFGCCVTSGGLAALDLATGEILWYQATIQEEPRAIGTHWLFVNRYAPSGATVWGSPTFDQRRDAVYFGTGQNYTLPATDTSDAIIAADSSTGEVRWVSQRTAGDAYNLACDISHEHPNCPNPVGPDVDFGAAPILATTRENRELLFAGQKSGDVYALDPDTGDVVWNTKVGRGGLLGGIHFGMAIVPHLNLLMVPVSDRETGTRLSHLEARPGLHALDMDTGEVVWATIRQAECAELHCWPGLSAAITTAKDLVFAAGLDGTLLAYSAKEGTLLWSHNAREVQLDAVNGGDVFAGAYDAHGVMVAGDKLVVASGYGSFLQLGGNALLLFELMTDE